MYASPSMDHHPGRFVDGDKVVIFIEHVKRDRFRGGSQRSSWSWFHFDNIAIAQAARSSLGAAVDEHAAGFDPLLKAGTAVVRVVLLQKLVQTPAGILFGRH